MGTFKVWDEDAAQWVVLGAGQPTGLMSARARRTSGNITANSTSWANLDTGLDLTIPAHVGDVLLLQTSGLWSTEAVAVGLDAVTVVSGSPVNSVSGSGASDWGVPAWRGGSGKETPIQGGMQYVVQSGDIVAGLVTLRLRYKTGSAANKTLYAGAAGNLQFDWSVTNLRGGAVLSGYPRGTSFPVPAIEGMMFYRTDVRGGMLFRYDGTRWLSDQVFSLQLGSGLQMASSQSYFCPIPADYKMWLTQAHWSFYGTGSWSCSVMKAGWDETYTTLVGPRDTSGHTSARWYGYTDAVGVEVDGTGANSGANAHALGAGFTRTSGTMYGDVAVDYRLIAT